jgi:hypothetical protein
MGKLKQRFASLVSAAIFLGFLWVLFQKVIIWVRVDLKWWQLIGMLIVFFFFIDTMVSRGFGTRGSIARKKDTLSELTNQSTRSAEEKLADLKDDWKRKDKN